MARQKRTIDEKGPRIHVKTARFPTKSDGKTKRERRYFSVFIALFAHRKHQPKALSVDPRYEKSDWEDNHIDYTSVIAGSIFDIHPSVTPP
jgi:hypothetical protein